MIVLRPDAATLGRIRLAASPAAEVAAWIRLAASGGRHPMFGDPGASARFALRDRDVALVAAAIGAAHYVPDLLTPVPGAGSWERTWAGQLERIGQSPEERAATQVPAHHTAGWAVPVEVCRAIESGRFARRAVDGLRRFHDGVLAGRTDYLGAVAAADVAYRGRVFAEHGLEQVLRTLHPNIEWTGAELQVTMPFTVATALTGVDLVLVPSVLPPPSVAVQIDDTADVYVRYPARGLNATVRGRRAGLPDLIGPSRAAILRDLEVPRTTTELSQRHTLAKSTVSHHLSVLLQSGLVARVRDGGAVRYGRTTRGDALIATA